MVLKAVKKTISEHNLICRGDSVLIGLSGGADSVCLTHVLNALKDELGITLCTAHLNHGIRGAEADRDESFAKSFSESLGIKCFTERADVPLEAKKRRMTEEEAGRRIRYEFFERVCAENGINKIATAHNRNDNAETLLMNFIRGGSLKGLSGIPHYRNNIIRPLLDVTRDEIEEYCRGNGLIYVTDSTNSDDTYTRNKIRAELIPLIQREFNSGFIGTVTENACLTADDSEYLEELSDKAYKSLVHGNAVPIDALLSEAKPIRRRIVRRMIADAAGGLKDVSALYTDAALSLTQKTSGALVNLINGVAARREYDKLIIEPQKETNGFYYTLKIGETLEIPEIGASVTASCADKYKKDGAVYLAAPSGAEIVIRSRKEGDFFCPYGMEGKKTVKKYFTDTKTPLSKRNRVPIIEINGAVAAVGDRIDRCFALCDSGIRIEFREIGR